VGSPLREIFLSLVTKEGPEIYFRITLGWSGGIEQMKEDLPGGG
jgi:hypothetical protein